MKANDYITRHEAIRALQINSSDYYGARRALCEIPAADVPPVVHGRWDDSGRFKFFDCDIAVRCSMCGGCLTEKEYAESVWNFCPVCGSKMDGGHGND